VDRKKGEFVVESKPWEWEKVEEAYWLEPATEVQALLGRWKKAGHSRLLDLGCGLGRHTLLFARAGFSVTGLDLSESGLSRLRGLSEDEGLEVLAVQGDLCELPFQDGAFDCVLAYRSIYHGDSQGLERCLREARRVLAPGGELFANFLAKESEFYRNGEGASSDPCMRMKVEEGGVVLPHCYLAEDELRSFLADFEIRSLRLDVEPERPGGSRYYTVLAG